jgi:hypothetical protein
MAYFYELTGPQGTMLYRPSGKIRVKQAAYKDRSWGFLLFVIVLGIIVGSAMGVVAKAITPVLCWMKPAPVETVRANEILHLPREACLGSHGQHDLLP